MEIARRLFYLQLESDRNDQKCKRLVLAAEGYPHTAYLATAVELLGLQGWQPVSNDLTIGEWKFWPASEYGDGLAAVILAAIAKDELVGESAKDAMHAIFWRFVVLHDEGIEYLLKYSEHAGNYYLMTRSQILENDRPAVKLVRDTILKHWHASDRDIEVEQRWQLLRACQRIAEDAELNDAVLAVQEMSGDDDTKTEHLLRLVEPWIVSVNAAGSSSNVTG